MLFLTVLGQKFHEGLAGLRGEDGFFWSRRTPFHSSRKEPHFLLFAAVRSPSCIFKTCSVTSHIFFVHMLELPWGHLGLHLLPWDSPLVLNHTQAPLAHNVMFTGSGPRGPQQGWLVDSGDNIGKQGK